MLKLTQISEIPLFTVVHCDPYVAQPYTTHRETESGEVVSETPSPIYRDDKGKLHINHTSFVENFASLNNMVCCNGLFYTPDGVVSETQVRKDVAYSLTDNGWTDRIDQPTNALFTALKYMHSVDKLPVTDTVIPFRNGDLHLRRGETWEFRENEKKQAPYRLGVDLIYKPKPMPKFEKWLKDLFDPADVPTIQEMIGYLLLPVTNAQEAFFLVGDAAAGKSVLGHILGRIINNGFQTINTQDFVTQRFQVADAENKLVLYDDDLGSAALTETGLLKKLITADQPIPAERKYERGFTFRSYAKVVACTNIMLSSLYDDTDGFFRRLHPIHVLPRSPRRKQIPGFGQQIAQEEAEAIAYWSLEGLRRLIYNDWHITWSDRSREYFSQVVSKAVHFPAFLQETTETGSSNDDVSSAELRRVYERWCRENNIQEVKVKRMQNWVADNIEKYDARPSKKVLRGGREVRGYKGIKIRPEWSEAVVRIRI